MRKKTFILATILATSLHAQNYTQVCQYNMGNLLPTDSVSFAIEYPEYSKLNKTEIHRLQKEGFIPQDHIQVTATRSISRGETIYDISFVPIVKKGSQWYEVKNYIVRPVIKETCHTASVKKIVLATETIAKQQRYAETSVLSKGKWVKIRVSKEGIYQLTITT